MNSQKGRQPKPWLEIIKDWRSSRIGDHQGLEIIKDWRSSRIGDHQGLEIIKDWTRLKFKQLARTAEDRKQWKHWVFSAFIASPLRPS